MTNDVFICYSHLDRQVALIIKDALYKNGIQSWTFEKNQLAGKPFEDNIVDIINDSKAVVLIHSSYSNESTDVINEIRIASKRKIPVISFRIENVEYSKGLDYYIGSLHWIEAFKPSIGDHIQELIDSVKQYLDGECDKTHVIELKNVANNSGLVKGKIYSRNLKLGIGNALVSILDGDTNSEIDHTNTDANGCYHIIIADTSNKTFQVYATKDPYNEGYSDRFSLKPGDIVIKNVHLTTDMRVLGLNNPKNAPPINKSFETGQKIVSTNKSSIAYGSVIGSVFDQNSVGIPNASVAIYRYKDGSNDINDILKISENPQITRDGRVGAVGTFLFHRVPVGKFIIRANKNNHMGYAIVKIEKGGVTETANIIIQNYTFLP